MIEATNKQIKYRYLFTQNLINFADTVKYLEKSIPEFNDIRPYGALNGLTPDEVYNKEMIPEKSPFNDRLKHAIENRYIQNKLNLCPICKD
ncbi:MAG: transposase [Candidatus Woesearchaeota archaeon]